MKHHRNFRLADIIDRLRPAPPAPGPTIRTIAVRPDGSWASPPASRREALVFRDALSELLLHSRTEDEFQDAIKDGGYWATLARMVKNREKADLFHPARVPRFQKVGFVYLMRNRRTQRYKIGFSTKPEMREKTLACEQPDIALEFSAPATMEDERFLHRHFAARRVRGEWFDLRPKDVTWTKKHLWSLQNTLRAENAAQ